MVAKGARSGRAKIGKARSHDDAESTLRVKEGHKSDTKSSMPASIPERPSCDQRPRDSKEKVVWEFLRISEHSGIEKAGSYEDVDEMAPDIARSGVEFIPPEVESQTPVEGQELEEDNHTAQLQEALVDERTELLESQGGYRQPEWTIPCSFDVSWLHELELEQASSDVTELQLKLSTLVEQRREVHEQYKAAQQKVAEEARRQQEQLDAQEHGAPGDRNKGKASTTHTVIMHIVFVKCCVRGLGFHTCVALTRHAPSFQDMELGLEVELQLEMELERRRESPLKTHTYRVPPIKPTTTQSEEDEMREEFMDKFMKDEDDEFITQLLEDGESMSAFTNESTEPCFGQCFLSEETADAFVRKHGAATTPYARQPGGGKQVRLYLCRHPTNSAYPRRTSTTSAKGSSSKDELTKGGSRGGLHGLAATVFEERQEHSGKCFGLVQVQQVRAQALLSGAYKKTKLSMMLHGRREHGVHNHSKRAIFASTTTTSPYPRIQRLPAGLRPLTDVWAITEVIPHTCAIRASGSEERGHMESEDETACRTSDVREEESKQSSSQQVGRSLKSSQLATALRRRYVQHGCTWTAKEVRAEVMSMDPGARGIVNAVVQKLRSAYQLDTSTQMEMMQGLSMCLREQGHGLILHVANARSVRQQALQLARSRFMASQRKLHANPRRRERFAEEEAEHLLESKIPDCNASGAPMKSVCSSSLVGNLCAFVYVCDA